MLIVKIMSGENLPDSDPRKTFHLIAGVHEVHFHPGGTWVPDHEALRAALADLGAKVPTGKPEPKYHDPQIFLNLGPSREPSIHKFDGSLGNVYVMNEAGKTIATHTPAPPPPEFAEVDEPAGMAVLAEDQIKHMVNRFLGWRLPEDFRPDCGIEFDADAAKKRNPHNLRYEPTGTNLFHYSQAEAMVRYMLEGLPAATVAAEENLPYADECEYLGDGAFFYDKEPLWLADALASGKIHCDGVLFWVGDEKGSVGDYAVRDPDGTLGLGRSPN